MGFDVAVLGHIDFPSSAKRAAWQRAIANPGDHDAEAAIMGFETDDDPTTVKQTLAGFADAKPTFLELENEGDRFRLRAVMTKDVWGAHGSRLMAVALAAGRAGGKGQLRFLGFIGIDYGVEVKVADGKSGARKLTEKQIDAAAGALEDLREAMEKISAEEAAKRKAKVAAAVDVGPLVDRLLAREDPSKEASQALMRAPRGTSAAIAAYLAQVIAKPSRSKKRDFTRVAKILSGRQEPASGTGAILPLYERPAAFVTDAEQLAAAMADAFLVLRDPPGLAVLARDLDVLFKAPQLPSTQKELERAIQATLFLDPKAAFDALGPRADRARVRTRAGKEMVGTIFASMRVLVFDPGAPMSMRWVPLTPLDARWAEVAASWLAPPADVERAEVAALVLAGLGDARGPEWYLTMFEKLRDYVSLNVPEGIEAVVALGDPRAADVLRKGAKRAATTMQARLFTNAAAKLEKQRA